MKTVLSVRCLVALMALLALASPSVVLAQRADDPGARVDELMAAYDSIDRPGGVVAVVERGEVVFAKGYGSANLEHAVPMTSETVLDIGSVAKQFTAFAIILLERDGKLSFDDDIRTHLPDVPDFGPTITVRHLVHHLSGLREIYNAKSLEGWQAGDGISQGDALSLTARMRELNFEPGTEHLYCNTGYMLLADIVAAASGMSFPDFMDDRVFGPLGMNHTTIMSRLGQSISGAAESYGRTPEGDFVRIFDNSALFGAGGIYTTAGDLAKWMGNFATGAVGGPSAIELLQQRGVLANGDTLAYAFGITVTETRGLRVLTHGGSSAGYRASFAYFPDLESGVITMSNFAQFSGAIPAQVAETFFGDSMDQRPEPVASAVVEPADAVVVSEALLESYVGEYELEIRPGFILTMTREGSQLFGQATGQGRNAFTATSDSTFDLGTIASITFHRQADGSVPSMTLHQNGDHVAHRRVAWTPTPAELAALAGRYFSPELQTMYTLVVEDGKLIAKHRRHADFELEPAQEDSYDGASFFGTARVERDGGGGVVGLRVSNGRVRNMWFEKLPG